MRINPETKKIEINSGIDVLIALLYAKGASGNYNETVRGITRLVKMLFLLEKESEFSDLMKSTYSFDAYDYGPFAPEILGDIEALSIRGILQINKDKKGSKIESVDLNPLLDDDETPEDSGVKTYKLSEKGEKLGKAIFEALSEEEKNYLITFKAIYNQMNLSDLLGLVYRKYPETTKKSRIKNKMLA